MAGVNTAGVVPPTMHGFYWKISPQQSWVRGYKKWVGDKEPALAALAERYSAEIVNWMRANATWQDRTGDARRLLWSDVHYYMRSIAITFGHGIWYGHYLEFSFEGRYQILKPAMNIFGARIAADIQAIMSA